MGGKTVATPGARNIGGSGEIFYKNLGEGRGGKGVCRTMGMSVSGVCGNQTTVDEKGYEGKGAKGDTVANRGRSNKKGYRIWSGEKSSNA